MFAHTYIICGMISELEYLGEFEIYIRNHQRAYAESGDQVFTMDEKTTGKISHESVPLNQIFSSVL